jgi:hypothetical protein
MMTRFSLKEVGYYFVHIMNNLRDQKLYHTNKNKDLGGLKAEAEFYQLHDLVEIINGLWKRSSTQVDFEYLDPVDLVKLSRMSTDNFLLKFVFFHLKWTPVIKPKEVTKWACMIHRDTRYCLAGCKYIKPNPIEKMLSINLVVAKKKKRQCLH